MYKKYTEQSWACSKHCKNVRCDYFLIEEETKDQNILSCEVLLELDFEPRFSLGQESFCLYHGC